MEKKIAPTLEQKKATVYAVKGSMKNLKSDEGVNLTKRTVTGFYNSFNFLDNALDVILPGAFNKSLAEHGPEAPDGNYKIKHLLHHNWEKVLSVPKVLEERSVKVGGMNVKGLYFETPMPNTTDGNDTLVKYQDNIYDQHSIGYQYIDGEYIENGAKDWDKWVKKLLNPEAAKQAPYMFLWKEIRLLEGSTVAFGCNELTPYLGVKAGNREGAAIKILGKIDIIKKQLTSGNISDDSTFNLEMQLNQLKQFISELFADVPDIKDLLRERQDGAEQKGTRFGQLGKTLLAN